MKLFVPPKRVNSDRALGQGWEMSLTLCTFFAIGFLLDRWLGTAPIAMIIATLLAAIGVFAKVRYAYEAQMSAYDRDREAAATPVAAVSDHRAVGGDE